MATPISLFNENKQRDHFRKTKTEIGMATSILIILLLGMGGMITSILGGGEVTARLLKLEEKRKIATCTFLIIP